jgi:hypothetical protein
MAEMIYVLTTIYVAYVIYRVVSGQKTVSRSPDNQAEPEKPVAPH